MKNFDSFSVKQGGTVIKVSNTVSTKELEIIDTRYLTADEYIKYKNIILQSDKEFVNLISSSIYSPEHFCVFNIGRGQIRKYGCFCHFAPAIVFESDSKYSVGSIIRTRGCQFLVLDKDLAIWCDFDKLPEISNITEIYEKSALEYLLDRWTECLQDENQPMPTRQKMQEWFRNYKDDYQSRSVEIPVMEQTNESYVEIDTHNSLVRYIPAIGETEVILPDGIEAIRTEAFFLNENEKAQIKSIHLPRTLKFIESRTFWDMHELESITVHPKNIAFKAVDGVLFQCEELESEEWLSNKTDQLKLSKLICYPPQKRDITEYRMPTWIQIAEGAFSECQLKTITLDGAECIQNGCRYPIRDYAFRNSKKLHTVNFISFNNFYGCHHFEGCNYGLRVNFNKRGSYLVPEGLVSKSGKELFYVAADVNGEWHAPEGIEKISLRHQLFANIKKVFLPDFCTRVYPHMFSYQQGLEEVHLGGIKSTKDLYFMGSKNLRLISGKALESIEGRTNFNGCVNLEKIITGPNCSFDPNLTPFNVVFEAPKGSETIKNAKKAGLKYKEV